MIKHYLAIQFRPLPLVELLMNSNPLIRPRDIYLEYTLLRKPNTLDPFVWHFHDFATGTLDKQNYIIFAFHEIHRVTNFYREFPLSRG